MDLNDDERLNNVFWANPYSKAAYEDFGDVVTFNTTYLTNRYGIPFAPFVGVNHHDGIAPRAIIIDQDRAMKNAIAIIFSQSRHRFCLWHILKKVPEKLSSYSAYKSVMKNTLMKCVYDIQNVEEFESSWEQLITTYKLEENSWLKSLYTEHKLERVFNQFDNALKKKIENENRADFHSFSVTIPCISRFLIEKKFQNLYTNAKFRKVQPELQCLINLAPELLKRDGGVKTYLVDDEVHVEDFTKLVTYSVDFSEVDIVAKYSYTEDSYMCGFTESTQSASSKRERQTTISEESIDNRKRDAES
ncbi:protein FAR1-RELATED SEQUENCE 5-like [Carya illinoinensis]|uniref:protein FAR1-RELATED SEQUENCE 5-like n=1 Tax=Carya illinoinensis TaxID=32201 RepID=UPI001C7185D2|nr:protein FAR1-RELATED SEQUENCE 5-like [Carya illinoinensis]